MRQPNVFGFLFGYVLALVLVYGLIVIAAPRLEDAREARALEPCERVLH